MKLTTITRAVALLTLLAAAPAVIAQTPALLTYQGRVQTGTPAADFTGNGLFKFALMQGNTATRLWVNNGPTTANPDNPVSLTVTNGLYSVLLGDASNPNMPYMAAIPPAVFANPDVRLRVWFNDGVNGFKLLTPDQRLAPNGYLPGGTTVNGNFGVSGSLNLPATTADGSGALYMDGVPVLHTYGQDNFFAGAFSGNLTMTGRGNTALGKALFNNTTGFVNTAIGDDALFNNTTGSVNTAIGGRALFFNTTGSGNTACGNGALISNGTGFVNTASGFEAL